MKKKTLVRIMVLTCLMGTGMNFHHPVTPTLFTAMNLPSRVFGTSFAVMCFFSFLTSVFWGEISDNKGRVSVFVVSCIFYGLAQFSLGFSSTELSVLISRGVAGAFSGGAWVATMAYVIDISPLEKRASNLAMYVAVQSISIAIGYLIGGVLGTISFSLAFNTQAIWMIGVGIAGYFILEESYVGKRQIKISTLIKSVNPFQSLINAKPLLNKMMIIFLIVVFLTGFGSSCYDNAFNYYLKDQLNFLPSYNGMLKAVIGIIGLVANFTINLWIIRKTNSKKSLVVVLGFCTLCALAALYSGNLMFFLLINLLFFTVNAIYQPIVQALAIEGKESSVTGVISGLYNAIKSVGNVVGSLLAGIVYGWQTLLPFGLAGVVFGLSAIFAYLYWKLSIKSA